MSDDDLRARVAEALPPHTEKHDPRNGPPYCDECSENAQNWVKWPCPAVVLRDAVLAALPRYEQVGWRSPSGYVSLPSVIEPDWIEAFPEDEPIYRRLPTEGAQP